ncbi:hypothetical protein H9P43_001412 [Blastocladiella emersonii ATCC 22665]|nr:hypothetical protein H9P43_001412 [Blastocladiella emersonii ATCC 22665]
MTMCGSMFVDEYEPAVAAAVRTIASPEPTTRAAALKAMIACAASAPRWITRVEHFLDVSGALTDVLAGDEVTLHRDYAALALARIINPLVNTLCVPHGWVVFAFEVAKEHMHRLLGMPSLEQLPHVLLRMYDRSPLIEADVVQSGLALVSLLGSFLSVTHLAEPSAEELLQLVFALLLRPEIHELVTSVAVAQLTEHLPRTNHTRALVEAVYRPLIMTLYELPEKLEPVPGHSSRVSSAAIPAPTYSARGKVTLSRFLSDWYPRPADATIRALPDHLFDTANKEGYVFRRRTWLTVLQRFRPAPTTPLLLYSVTRPPNRDLRSVPFADYMLSYDLASLWDVVRTLATASTPPEPPGPAIRLTRLLPGTPSTPATPATPSAQSAPATPSQLAPPSRETATRQSSPGTASGPNSLAPPSAVGSPPSAQAMSDSDAELNPVPIPMSMRLYTKDPVWEADVLALSIPHGQTVQFLRPPFTRLVFISNRSPDHAAPFHVQVWPKAFFSVHPAAGIVPPEGHVPLVLTFNAKPNATRSLQEVDGFIRVRDRFGFPVCRFPLRGTILPAIHCPTRELDFGLCTPGEVRALVLPVHNMTNTECNCSLAVAQGSVFLAVPPHFILQPKEQKLMKIKFIPSHNSPLAVYEETLILSTDSGEEYRIKLRGTARASFAVHTAKLDFGLIDMTWGPMSRSLLLENLSDTSLPISFVTSTRELIVPTPLTLDPFERRKVPIEFHAAYHGARSERLTVTAPFGINTAVEVSATAGRTLYTPLHEEAFMAPLVGQPGVLVVPVVSMVAGQSQVLIEAPPELTMRLLDVRSYNNEAVTIDLQPYSSDGGYVLTFSGMGTAPVEIAFNPIGAGRWVFELTLSAFKPPTKRSFISRHLIYAMATTPGFVAGESFLADARSLLASQAAVKAPAPNGEIEDDGSASVPAACFEIDPSSLVLHGNHKLGKFQCQGTISISNVTSQRQNYHIIAPPWIKFTVPLDGSIPALSALDIPITVEVPPRYSTQDRMFDLFLGFFAVVDDKSPRGISQCSIQAVAMHPVQLEVRKDMPTIQFPATKVLSKVNRRIPLRNCLPVESVWEGRIYLTKSHNRVISPRADDAPTTTGKVKLIGGASDMPGAGAGDDEVRNPFSLLVSKFILKPFAVVMVEINLQATGTGRFSSQLEYELFSTQKYSTSVPKFSFTLGFECDVGKVEPIVHSDAVIFPDTCLSQPTERPLHVENLQMLVAPIQFYSPIPSISFAESSLTIPPGRAEFQVVSYAPNKPGYTSGFIHVAAYLWSTLIPLAGRGGHYALHTDTGLNLLGDRPVLDIGRVLLSRRKEVQFRIVNAGTLDVTIMSMQIDPVTIFSLDVVQDADMVRPDYCEFAPYEQEVDWDEVDVRQVDQPGSSVNGTRLIAGRMSRRRDRKSVFGRGTVTVAAISSVFPVLLRPNQSCIIVLHVQCNELKPIAGRIRTKLLRLNGDIEEKVVQVVGECIRPLSISEKKIDFGICDALHRHTRKTRVANPSTVPMQWRIAVQELTLHHPKTMEEQSLHVNHHFPVQFVPDHGFLMPGRSESVDVVVYSNLNYSEISAACVLTSPGICSIPFHVHAIAATAHLSASATRLDFSVLGVGKVKLLRLTLTNSGGIPCTFMTHCSHPVYFCEPEQGVIDSENGSMTLDVAFSPRTSGPFDAGLEIRYSSTEGYFYPSINVALCGIGGYPDLYVHTKEIDFGTAIFGNDNVQLIHVENKGDAEAQVSLLSYHPAIFLNTKDPVIPPKSSHHLSVIFRPIFVETLNTKLFLKSADSRSDVFLVKVKGKVGVSRLAVTPADQFAALDFGTCLTQGTYTKKFTLKNTGNIPLAFNISFDAPSDELNPFLVNLVSGSAKVDEEFELHVMFKPKHMRSYSAKLEINYDHHLLTTQVTGIGGQMLITLLPSSKVFDFGLCRLNRVMKKEIALDNKGNYGMPFQAYIVNDASGFRVVNPNGFCRPGDKTSIFIEFVPRDLERVRCMMRIECGTEVREIELAGCGAESKLVLLDSLGAQLLPEAPEKPPLIDLGIHPLGSQHQVSFKLVNEGPFGIDFFIEPFRVPELLITPQRGYVEPLSSAVLILTFSPQSESSYTGLLNILWENGPIAVSVKAAGGVGKLDVKFSSQLDLDQHCIDFGMVPVQSTLEKRFYLTNDGLVDVVFDAFVTSPDFLIGGVGEPFLCSVKELLAIILPPSKKPVWQMSSNFKARLKPKHGLEIAVRYTAKTQVASKCNMCISSDTLQVNMEVRGKGGTINISHKGSLVLDDVAVHHTATRKLAITNSGSIPALLTFGWSLIRGGDNSGPYVELNETVGALDPRNGWARLQFNKELAPPADYKMTAKDYWWMLRRIVSSVDPNEEAEERTRPSSRAGSTFGLSMNTSMELGANGGGGGGGGNTGKSTFGLFKTGGGGGGAGAGGGGANSKAANERKNNYRIHSKRRQIFLANVAHTPMTSQMLNQQPSFIRVHPASCVLPGFGEAELTVEANLPTEETFLATLLCIPNVPNTPPYEIAMSATPKLVSVVMNDSRPVDFGCQQLGHREVINRIFTNVGRKPFAFVVEQGNRSVTVFPNRGYLEVGQSVMIQFAFEPTDESLQSLPGMFIPDCSQPIRIKISGSGGRSRMSLFKYKRFDFGHCMIGKDTLSYLPIANEGNAILHLTKFDLIPSDSFFKGPGWPATRVSVQPGETYQLPLVFNPHTEAPNPGKLLVGNDSESYDIQLTGIGREAVLIVTKVMLEFADCLIGNTYTQKIGIKNVGDVNYPVTFELEGAHASLLEFVPPKMTILPFSENMVQVIYKPTKEMKLHTTLTINSPYSVNTLPVVLHSGYANLTLSSSVLDFGMFEKSTRPVRNFVLRNTGSVNIVYAVRQSSRPHLFHITNGKGMVPCGKEVQIGVSYIQSTVGHFSETLVIKTELQSAQYTVTVRGECEEALVRHEEFQLLNLGTCPVLEATSKTLSITNYGKFPLKFQIKNTYPIKVNKTAGEIAGETTENLAVIWNPSGGYELRTQLHVVTNVGTFQVVVRGKAAFPELVLKNNYFDFGVCAIGHTYYETLELHNKGKVPLHWSIPNVRDCYTVSCQQGTLGAKDTKDVQIAFRPTAVGRYGSSFIIESKGLNFKEVALIGVGGAMLVDVPAMVDLGQCPCDHPITKSFVVFNRGDVPIHATFDAPPAATAAAAASADNPAFVISSLPVAHSIRPGKSATLHFSVKAFQVGQIETSLVMSTREKKYTIALRGHGVKITLKESIMELLELDVVQEAKQPTEIVVEKDLLDVMMHRIQTELPKSLDTILAAEPDAATKLIEDRRPEPQGELWRFERFEDYYLDRILHFPVPRVTHGDLSVLTNAVEPSVYVALDPLLARPPPIPANKTALHVAKPSKSTAWHTPPLAPIKKSERRARTFQTFRAPAPSLD